MDEILLIEDDQSLRRAVSLKLTKEGYHVYAAESIAQGWELYEKHSIMLILCDVGLPDGSGLDFCIQVRKQEERCGCQTGGFSVPDGNGCGNRYDQRL